MNKNARHIIHGSFWILFLGLFVLLSLNRHSKTKPGEYHHEIWADKAGYYVYLPFFFIQDADVNRLPVGIDAGTGFGFLSDTLNHKLRTKYTCGVAALEAPFFFANYWIIRVQGQNPTGFEKSFGTAISIAAAFWLSMGLFLYTTLLRNWLSLRQSILSSLILICTTNLLYYGIFETGMSHVYSFFAFSLYLFCLSQTYLNEKKGYRLLTGLSIGLIILIRPINALFLPLPLIALYLHSRIAIIDVTRRLLHPKIWLTALIVILPQFFYWYQLTGSPIHFSYTGEGFDHLTSPRIVEYWFAPHNGLLPYHPIWIIALMFLLFVKSITPKIRIFGIFIFVLFSYLFSSWWNWSYGCGYGCRTMAEFATLFFLPFLTNLHQSSYKRTWLIIILIFTLINIKMMFSYDGCWYAGDWDWTPYLQLISGPFK